MSLCAAKARPNLGEKGVAVAGHALHGFLHERVRAVEVGHVEEADALVEA